MSVTRTVKAHERDTAKGVKLVRSLRPLLRPALVVVGLVRFEGVYMDRPSNEPNEEIGNGDCLEGELIPIQHGSFCG